MTATDIAMKAYYIFRDDRQEGPFSLEEIKWANIAGHHLVWHEGLDNWIPASELTDLQPLFRPADPTPLTIAEKLGSMPQPTHFEPVRLPPMPAKKSGNNFWIVLLMFAGPLAAFFYYRDQQSQPESLPLTPAQSAQRSARENIRNLVKTEVQGFKAKKAPGGITDVKIQLDNTSDYELEQVKVKVDYLKPSGLVWKTAYLSFRNVHPQSAPLLKAPDSFRGTGVKAEVILIKSAALGM